MYVVHEQPKHSEADLRSPPPDARSESFCTENNRLSLAGELSVRG